MITHGHAPRSGFSPTYHSWAAMCSRCGNPKHRHWARYGGRGIAVCRRWRAFENFLADMGERPAGTEIERKDNDRGYEPGNCKWATRREQNRNSSQVVWVEIAGERRRLVEWCEHVGISINTVRCRVRKHGMTYAAAITTPIQSRPGEAI